MSLSEVEFQAAIDGLQAYLDTLVEEGNDQELFIAGYLNGHFSLAAGYCLSNNLFNLESLKQQVRSSLEAAFANNELELPDQHQVWQFWQTCCDKL